MILAPIEFFQNLMTNHHLKESGKRFLQLNPRPFVKQINKDISIRNRNISVLEVSSETAPLKDTTNSVGIEKFMRAFYRIIKKNIMIY